MMKETEVVAALIWNGDRFLACQRPAHKARGLLWEFVGGKVEAGERREDALIRECFEETDIVLNEADVVRELEPYQIRFIDHHSKAVCKIVYPVVFRADSCGAPRAKEVRMIDAHFMNIEEFLTACTYDNVKQIVKQAIEI